MDWLEPAKVLPLAGYIVPDPLEDTREAEALAYAERLIESFTGSSWGAVVPFTERHHLTAKSWFLPLPLDIVITEPITVAPSPAAGYTLEVGGRAGLYRVANGQQVPWDAGSYTITGSRGLEAIPADVNKAASLLAAHYLSLSDPERSRYEMAALGDFSGSMRLHELIVPEAAILLRRYRREVHVSL